jgi:hypothetical protein
MSETSVQTFRADDLDPTLLELRWTGISDQEQLWQKLFQVLDGLASRQGQLGTILFAELTVELSPTGEDDARVEYWPVEFGPGGLERLTSRYAAALASGNVYVMPFRLNLNLEAYLFLPAGVQDVRVLWYETPDFLDLGPLAIRPATQVEDAPGLTRWQSVSTSLHAEAGSAVYIDIDCELSPWNQYIALDVRSRFDLWRSVRPDGAANEPYAVYNFRHLQATMQDLATATGGMMV